MAETKVTTSYNDTNNTVSYTLGYVPKYRGDWSSSATYYPSNIVRYSGKCFIFKSTTPVVGTAASPASSPLNDTDNWDVLAEDTSTGSIKSVKIGSTVYAPETGSDQLALAFSDLGITVNNTSPDSTGNITVDVAKTTSSTPLTDSSDLLATTSFVQNNLANYATKNGSQLSGALTNASNSSETVLAGGTDWDNGAALSLRGDIRSTDAGTFVLKADNGSTETSLTGTPSGSLTWNNNEVLTTGSSINASQLTGTGAINVTGNAGTATKLATGRSISISNGATASGITFDGSANITLNVTSLDASKLTGTGPINISGNAASANYATSAGNSDTTDGVHFRTGYQSGSHPSGWCYFYGFNAGGDSQAIVGSTGDINVNYASSANYANSAGSASSANSATNANYATTAGTANYATSAGTANSAKSCPCRTDCSDSCFISGLLITDKGPKPIQYITKDDVLVDIKGNKYSVIRVDKGTIGNKKVITNGKAMFTEDHTFFAQPNEYYYIDMSNDTIEYNPIVKSKEQVVVFLSGTPVVIKSEE